MTTITDQTRLTSTAEPATAERVLRPQAAVPIGGRRLRRTARVRRLWNEHYSSLAARCLSEGCVESEAQAIVAEAFVGMLSRVVMPSDPLRFLQASVADQVDRRFRAPVGPVGHGRRPGGAAADEASCAPPLLRRLG